MEKSTRRLIVAGLLLTLLIAVVVSQFASSSPDGLEYVAEQQGFIDTASSHDLAGGPLADYGSNLTDNNWVNTAVAGLAGTLATLAIGYGIFWLVRKRDDGHPETGS